MKVGRIIKALRRERKMTLKDLSKKSGVAIATLSRIEHDIMTGTIDSHLSICRALGISIVDLYGELENTSKSVSLSKDKTKYDLHQHDKKTAVELLTTNITDKKMMPVQIRMQRGGHTQTEKSKPGIEKFIYVVLGSLTAEIGKDKYTLSAGDSLYFEGSLPHRFSNDARGDVIALYVSSPPAI